VPASRLAALRIRLEQQRRFRREQLAELEAGRGMHERSALADRPDPAHAEAVSALREVDDIVAAGARRALADIELALVRMRTGRYGLCRSCGAGIPLVVLEAIPKTTLCLRCLWRSESSDAGGPRSAGAPTRRSRGKPAGPQRRSRRVVDPVRA
jgi:DnaK suppressor protein